jgi:hypothetical protein
MERSQDAVKCIGGLAPRLTGASKTVGYRVLEGGVAKMEPVCGVLQ